ncbi:Scr1 family TA system antitoxin-like transcriptional regulator [Streptomyces yaizuensis]|uniref:Scr1 family TA system antitoxin-like transcriptional regulator n=1 Tax=Streptomyces yaizuensis TaxID=2989713 RepID=A0ABQ5P475_9ACTN|nr:Scr1 family TA system antitoxin-like transcriptional regulator [Streptomyces sp. YSPA8]
MVNRKELDPESSPEAAFGARLRSSREMRGWKQEDLAVQMEFSSGHISAVETGRKLASLRFARSADAAFGLDGIVNTFERQWREIRHGALLEGFPEYVGYEGRAAEIRLYEVGVIPGLLQTPEYAAAVETSSVDRGALTAEQARERITVVAERQAALDRTPPPLIHAVLDESCIRRTVGGPALMEAQLARLVEFASHPNHLLQIAPFTMGERRPFNLPVTVLTMSDRSIMFYAEAAYGAIWSAMDASWYLR